MRAPCSHRINGSSCPTRSGPRGSGAGVAGVAAVQTTRKESLMNLRTMSILVGATLVTLTASRNVARQAAQHPDLSGRWTYNAAQSTSPGDMLQGGATSGGEQRGGGGGGGRRGGFGGGGRGGFGGGRGGY